MKKYLIVSGKGGVGKTTVTVFLAKALTILGKKIGILDADLNTANVPLMLGDSRKVMKVNGKGIYPNEVDGIKVVSYWYDTANGVPHLLMAGDRISKILKAFCENVIWGDIDVLLVDFPPVTSDELIGAINMLGHIDGAIIVIEGSTRLSVEDAKRAKLTLNHFNVPIIGFVKNKVSPYYDEGVNVESELRLKCLGEIKLKRRKNGHLTLSPKDFIPIAKKLEV